MVPRCPVSRFESTRERRGREEGSAPLCKFLDPPLGLDSTIVSNACMENKLGTVTVYEKQQLEIWADYSEVN